MFLNNKKKTIQKFSGMLMFFKLLFVKLSSCPHIVSVVITIICVPRQEKNTPFIVDFVGSLFNGLQPEKQKL